MVITSCTRNAVVHFWARGFESHTLRQNISPQAVSLPVGFFVMKAFGFHSRMAMQPAIRRVEQDGRFAMKQLRRGLCCIFYV